MLLHLRTAQQLTGATNAARSGFVRADVDTLSTHRILAPVALPAALRACAQVVRHWRPNQTESEREQHQHAALKKAHARNICTYVVWFGICWYICILSM